MRQKSGSRTASSEKVVKGICRATRKRHSSEEKIRIALDGLRGKAFNIRVVIAPIIPALF